MKKKNSTKKTLAETVKDLKKLVNELEKRVDNLEKIVDGLTSSPWKNVPIEPVDGWPRPYRPKNPWICPPYKRPPFPPMYEPFDIVCVKKEPFRVGKKSV